MKRPVSQVALLVVSLAALPMALRPQQTQDAPSHGPAPAPDQVVVTAPPAAAAGDQNDPLFLATVLYRAGKLDEALEAYRKLSAEGRSAASGYAGMARVYLKQQKFDEASAAAAKAVEIAPNSPDAHAALGEVLFRKGQILAAQKEFLPFVKADTKEARCYLGMWRVYRAASYHKSAKIMIDEAHALDPEDPEIAGAWTSSVSVEDRIKALQAQLAEGEKAGHGLAALQLSMLRDQVENYRPCRMVSNTESTQVALEPLYQNAKEIRGYGLRVKLNSGSGRLLVDTGASGILVVPRVAEKAGLKRLGKEEIHGVGSEGVASGYSAAADVIKIGDMEFHDCTVSVVEKKNALDVDGLIGPDVLSRFLVELDFPDAKLRLSPLPAVPDEPPMPPALESVSPLAADLHNRYVAPEMKGYTPVFRFGHYLLAETWIKDSPSLLFLLDTGAFDDQISPDVARAYTKVRKDSNITVTGLNGKVDRVYTADNVILTFGHLRQVRHNLIAWDLSNISRGSSVEMSGILGFDMLKLLDLKIDYRDGLVDFSYNPSRAH